MRLSRSFALVSLVLLVPSVIAGCSNDPDAVTPADPVVADAPLALEGEIGPEGGVLEGRASSEFRGVKLEVPAGALAKKTKLSIVPSLDPTGLPELAARVGPGFALEGDPTFEKPVRLTLPVDREFQTITGENQGRELKVWMRDGEGFRLIEPVATSASTITIETVTIRFAAAGLKLNPAPKHPGCGPVGCVDLVACTEAAGMCIGDPLDLPFVGATGMFRPTAYPDRAGEAIVFHNGLTNGTVGKLTLPSNQASFSTFLSPPLGESGLSNQFVLAGRLVSGVAGDANTAVLGRFAMPTSGRSQPPTTGNAAPAFVSTPSRAAVTLGDGRTAVLLTGGGGTPFRVSSFVLRSASGQVSAPIALAGPGREMLAVVADPSRGDAFWMVSQINGSQSELPSLRIDRFDATGNVLVSPSISPALRQRFLVGIGGAEDGEAIQTTGVVATSDGLFLGIPNFLGSTSLLRVGTDGALEERAALGPNVTNMLELDADRQGNIWLRTVLPDGTSGLLFLGKDGKGTPGFVETDRTSSILEMFPSADQGIWLAGRPLTGTVRPLRLVKVRVLGR